MVVAPRRDGFEADRRSYPLKTALARDVTIGGTIGRAVERLRELALAWESVVYRIRIPELVKA